MSKEKTDIGDRQQVEKPTQMHAIQYDHYGPPEVLQMRTTPIPELRPGHVLIRVMASSINAADVAFRSGKLKLLTGRKFPRGAGFDFAGDVVAVGSAVEGLQVGDSVWGFVRPSVTGSAADYVVAPITSVSRRPRTIDAVEAAALSGAGAAAVGVLRDAAQVKSGERILIRGAAGGFGTVAVQVALALGGRVTALLSAKDRDAILNLGAEEAFDYHTTDPRDLGTFDVVIDTVGKNLSAYRRLLAPGGRMLTIAIGGLGDILYVALSTVFGSHRVRFVQKPPTRELLTSLTEFVDNKAVKPVIDSIYPLDDIVGAHRAQEAGKGFGKRVVRLI